MIPAAVEEGGLDVEEFYEVMVLKKGEQMFEYIACHGETGMLVTHREGGRVCLVMYMGRGCGWICLVDCLFVPILRYRYRNHMYSGNSVIECHAKGTKTSRC